MHKHTLCIHRSFIRLCIMNEVKKMLTKRNHIAALLIVFLLLNLSACTSGQIGEKQADQTMDAANEHPYTISNSIVSTARNIIESSAPLFLHVLSASPFDAENLFFRLSKTKDLHDAEITMNKYGEDYLGDVYIIIVGEMPFPDYYLSTNYYPNTGLAAASSIMYHGKQYNYIEAIFDPDENVGIIGDEAFDFCTPEEAMEAFSSIFYPQIAFGEITCGSVSGESLQLLYNERKRTNTFREEFYAAAGSGAKDTFGMVEKSEWTDQDSFYYIAAHAALQQVPVYGSHYEAMIDRDGVVALMAEPQEAAPTGEAQEIADIDAVLNALDSSLSSLPEGAAAEITGLDLFYIADPKVKDAYTLIPCWNARAQYHVTLPNGVNADSEVSIWLNAWNCEEVIPAWVSVS